MALHYYATSLLCFLRMRDGETLALQLFADEKNSAKTRAKICPIKSVLQVYTVYSRI